MSEVTVILEAIAAGNRQAAADLIPIVYDELRRLAAALMAGETPGHTLHPTALVHEAYLRLVGEQFDGRTHFFTTAAESMRRILIDYARSKTADKRGGKQKRTRQDVNDLVAIPLDSDRWLDLDEVLVKFEAIDPVASQLAVLHIFSGLSIADAGESLNLSKATAYRLWNYAEAWLTTRLADADSRDEFAN